MKSLLQILQQIEDKSEEIEAGPRIPSLIEEIEDDRLKKIVMPKISIVEKEIKELLLRIKNCINAEEANIYFDLLQKIQEILAKLVYKQKVNVSKSLEKFVSDFDRIDDEWLRDYLFNLIKKNNYSL